MKILLVNKFLYPKGGAETYVFKMGKMLEDHGHEVQYFGMGDVRNTVGNSYGLYAPKLDLKAGVMKNLDAPFKIIYSHPAKRQMEKLLRAFRPDVIHFNNIQFYLTPSIILAAGEYKTRMRARGRKNVRLVYTAHDYQLVCPSHGLFDTNIHPCEKCLDMHYWPCLMTKCVKNSRAKSLLGMLDAYYWKYSRAYSYIDTIICPSRFLKSKLDTQRRFSDKTVAIHNFIDKVRPLDVKKEGYVLEFGHLSRDKGTETLLAAARNMPETKFVFAGYGESAAHIADVKNAEYVGFQTGNALEMLIRKASVAVVPSEMYENCSLSIIEAQMYGTPVLVSRMGGNPELLEEGKTGETFEAGNIRDLENKLREMLSDGRAERYSKNCKSLNIETTETYYQRLIKIYEERR